MSHAPAAAIPTSYLFIDGESFNHMRQRVSSTFFAGIPMEIEWGRVKGEHRKVFFYDAIPVQGHNESGHDYDARVAGKRAELASMERETAYHVRTGDAITRRRRGNEQKMVDVQLAVDALLMASRGLFSKATFITGDLDFRPLISALVDMGIDVHLRYPEGETNEHLLAAADYAYPIDVTFFRDALTEEFRRNNPLPSAYFGAPPHGIEDAPTAITFEDSDYGVCTVKSMDGNFVLVSERAPLNPHTSLKLVVSFTNLDLLRAYAAEAHKITIPTI